MDEIKIIGKFAEISGVACNVAGIVRYGSQLRLIVIQYDEQLRQQIEERELSEICGVAQAPETNRIFMKSREKVSHPFMSVKGVRIGDNEFEVSGWENQRLSVQDGESVVFLWELLKSGWNPEGIDYQNIDMLFFTMIEIAGDFNKIPEFDSNSRIHFTMRKDSVSCVVEQPVTLTVNGEYTEKLWFKNKETGEEHWAQINKVYLNDILEEMEKSFSHPRLLKQMTKEQIDKARKDFEKSILEICPKGMRFPVVEYECEEGISLDFHTKEFLQSKPAHRNGGMGFILGTEKPTGMLGMKLKAALIQEPVAVDAVNIEAELFQYYEETTPDDIVL